MDEKMDRMDGRTQGRRQNYILLTLLVDNLPVHKKENTTPPPQKKKKKPKNRQHAVLETKLETIFHVNSLLLVDPYVISRSKFKRVLCNICHDRRSKD